MSSVAHCQHIWETPGYEEDKKCSQASLLPTGFWQSSSHFILGGVNVAGCPPTLSAERHQSLDEHLDTQTQFQMRLVGLDAKRARDSYCGLRGDVSAAHNLGTCQRFLTLCSLPEWNQSWHIWEKKQNKSRRRTQKTARHHAESRVTSTWKGRSDNLCIIADGLVSARTVNLFILIVIN